MSESLKTVKPNIFTYVTVLAVTILLVYLAVSNQVNQRLALVQQNAQIQIAEQEKLLVSIAEITARNGADDVTERIIRDCSLDERTNFDQLLGRLDSGLDRTQLTELERLFGRCGNFFAERKAVMSARMEREIQVYETYVEQLNALTDDDELQIHEVEKWRTLSDLELQQSDLFTNLVNAQDQIIALLLQGNSAASDEVVSVVQEANEIQGTLTVARKQAETIRSELIAL